MHLLPGQTEKIRLTVAYAERYGLIAEHPLVPGVGGCGAFRTSEQLRMAASCFFVCTSEDSEVLTKEKQT